MSFIDAFAGTVLAAMAWIVLLLLFAVAVIGLAHGLTLAILTVVEFFGGDDDGDDGPDHCPA